MSPTRGSTRIRPGGWEIIENPPLMCTTAQGSGSGQNLRPLLLWEPEFNSLYLLSVISAPGTGLTLAPFDLLPNMWYIQLVSMRRWCEIFFKLKKRNTPKFLFPFASTGSFLCRCLGARFCAQRTKISTEDWHAQVQRSCGVDRKWKKETHVA